MKANVSHIIAQGLIDLGVEVVTNVPGHGGSQTLTAYNELAMKNISHSFHEEVAYTIAHGASIVGIRSAALIKSQGVAKAANSVVDSLYTRLTAGFVVFVFDDQVGSHSDNIMEIEPMLEGMNFPSLRCSKENAYNDLIQAYEKSEKLKLPVALIVNAFDVDMESEFEQMNNLKKSFSYKRDVLDHVVHPLFAKYQYKVFTANKMKGDYSIIQKPKLPKVPDELPEKFKDSAQKYEQFFKVFKDMRGDIVTGDTSSSSVYCLPDYNAIDMITYIGGSIPLAIGSYLAGKRNVWAVTGDFGFISAGHYGLLEAANRNIPIKIVVLYNRQASATGGQKISKNIMLRIIAGYDHFTRHIHNPSDPIEVETVLDEAANSDELRLILVHY